MIQKVTSRTAPPKSNLKTVWIQADPFFWVSQHFYQMLSERVKRTCDLVNRQEFAHALIFVPAKVWDIVKYPLELQIRCVKSNSTNTYCVISSPNSIFDHLLESSRWDDSNKWSNIGYGEEKGVIEIGIRYLSGALDSYLSDLLLAGLLNRRVLAHVQNSPV